MTPQPPRAANPLVELRDLSSPHLVAELAALHAEVFPDAEGTALGRGYLSSYFDWYRRAERAVALVAWREQSVGYVLGSPYGSERQRYRELFAPAARAGFRRPSLWLRSDLWRVALWRLGSLAHGAAQRPVGQLAAPVYLLDLIGVAPGERHRGVGALLLEGFRSAAEARGARSLVLWARDDAPAARRAYERAGWRRGWSVWPDRTAYWRDSGSS